MLRWRSDYAGPMKDKSMSDDPVLAALARLDAKVEQLDAKIDQLEGKFDAKLERLDTKIDKTRADIMARIDRLQDQGAQHVESGVISVALATNTANDAKAARESAAVTTETLGLLATQVQRLNVRVAALENKAPCAPRRAISPSDASTACCTRSGTRWKAMRRRGA